MAEKHLDAHFSAAYDDELDPGARRRFDAHLEACTRCENAWDEYRAALDAVRALPAVAMPATVRLPVGPPHVEAGRAAVLARLRSSLLHPPPVWAAAGLAAVSVALVVLAVHHGGGGTVTNTPGVAYTQAEGGAGSRPEPLNAVPAPRAPAAPGAADRALGSVVPCPVSQVAPGSTGASSSGFSHTTSTAVGGGRQFVLATPADTYPPGASVPIYARLTGGGSTPGSTDVVPCVTLETGGGSAGAGAAGAPAPQAAAGGAAPSTPIAVATAQPQSAQQKGAAVHSTSSPGDLSVTIPPNIPRGSHLRLVALIPAASSPTGAPLQIELDIIVG
jgi:hypothetical protein